MMPSLFRPAPRRSAGKTVLRIFGAALLAFPMLAASLPSQAGETADSLLDLARRDPGRVLEGLEKDRLYPDRKRAYTEQVEALAGVILDEPPTSGRIILAAQILGALTAPWQTSRADAVAERLNALIGRNLTDARTDLGRALANLEGLYIDATRQELDTREGYMKALAGYAAMSRYEQTPYALVSEIRLALMLGACDRVDVCNVADATRIASDHARRRGAETPPAAEELGRYASETLQKLNARDPKSGVYSISPDHWRWRNDTTFALGIVRFLDGDTAAARTAFEQVRDWPRQLDAYGDDLPEQTRDRLALEEPDYRDQVFVWTAVPGRGFPKNRHFAASVTGTMALRALAAAEQARNTKSSSGDPLTAFVDTFETIENDDNVIIFGSFRSPEQARNFLSNYQPVLNASRDSARAELPDLTLKVGDPGGGSSWYSVSTLEALTDSEVGSVLDALRDSPAFRKVQPYTNRPRVQ